MIKTIKTTITFLAPLYPGETAEDFQIDARSWLANTGAPFAKTATISTQILDEEGNATVPSTSSSAASLN